MKRRTILKPALNVLFGAGTVVGGVYIFSRIKEKQETETRLDRMEQMIEALSEKKESAGKS